jgi:hypothetical protein
MHPKLCVILALPLLLLVVGSAPAATLRVPADYPTIQAAIDASSPDDSVLVAPGTYLEMVSIRHALALLSEAGAEVTTIDAQGQGGGPGPVIFVHRLTGRVTIQGFRITGGDIDYNDLLATPGGGIYSGTSDPELIICQNIVEYNQTAFSTGGIQAAGSMVRIDDNIVQYNNPFGGEASRTAVTAEEVASFSRNIIRHNGAPAGNADSYTVLLQTRDDPLSVMSDNVITDNHGVYINVHISNIAAVQNNTIANNGATHTAVSIGGSEFIRNNLITHGQERGLSCGAGAIVSCNDVWGPGQSWANACAGQAGMNGNFSADPRFCDPAAEDYRLSADSPCAPENAPPGCGLIGALPVGCGAAGVVDGASTRNFNLTVRPNPARRGAEFLIETHEESFSLEIYDPIGRLVDLLSPGSERVVQWKPRESVEPGIYFARLRGPAATTKVVKFVLLH